MKIARVNSRATARTALYGTSAGSNNQVLASGSNGETFWSPFVRSITADGSNVLLRPDVNLASGSNIVFTFDRPPLGGGAFPSNTVRIHSTATGGGSGGSGTLTTVEEVDGSPTDSAVTKLVFPNGTLSIVSHVATYTPTSSGGSGEVWLQRQTASTSATLDFTSFISSTYDVYIFYLTDLVMATDGVDFLMRMGTGGGPTYDSGANYSYDGFVWRSAATGTFGGTSATSIALDDTGGNIDNSTSSDSFSGRLALFNPNGASHWKRVLGETSYRNNVGPSRIGTLIRANYESTTAVTAVRFLASSGNISSGSIDVYGLVHA